MQDSTDVADVAQRLADGLSAAMAGAVPDGAMRSTLYRASLQYLGGLQDEEPVRRGTRLIPPDQGGMSLVRSDFLHSCSLTPVRVMYRYNLS